MSSNVISQSPAPDRKDVLMDHPSSTLSLPKSGTQTTLVVNSLSDSGMHNFSLSKEAMTLDNPGFKTSTIMNKQVGGSLGSVPMWISNQPGNNFAREKMLHPVKRKAEVVASFTDSGFKESQVPNKRPLHLGTNVRSPGLPQPSIFQKKTSATQPKSGSSGLAAPRLLNKKLVRNDSIQGKSGSEAVRTKMKESLTSALYLVKQHNISNSQKDQIDGTISRDVPVDSAVSKADSTRGVLALGSNSGLEEVFIPQESFVAVQTNNNEVYSADLPLNPSSGNGSLPFNDFQYSSMLPDDDITFSDSFFVKDDLLQGNGLLWAFDFDVQLSERSEAQNSEKQSSEQDSKNFGVRDNVAILTPENVASVIELELFKLFGGVNKKYKEKGRSLLFNLKDHSNPELRERVMAGEISPNRLCSMSAEELASEELSQWRMAKAEELAQMVVLPDTEVDFRRLVRKTHKGEYQVEIEYDDGISSEVSGGSSVLTLPRPTAETNSPLVVNSKEKESDVGQKSSSINQDVSGSLIIQTDGADLMQGMMVDELRDAEFLPPIVSLDEFMESMDSEPPFESLSADAVQKTTVVNKESLESSNKEQAPARDSDSPGETPSGKADVSKRPESVTTLTLSISPVKQNVLPDNASGVEYIWKGILQLNTSASITVGCMYQSGEKTSTEKWPISLEIMGRVRLDSFEKFVRELPLSRTRAIMALELVLTDMSSETESSYLSEAVELYTVEERVGYAEPTTGVELYLCPPTSKMIDLLKQLMRKERSDTDNSLDNKLIGVVVWRRAHISKTLSPNSSSHNKHSSKKLSPALPKRVEDISNANVYPPITTPSLVLINAAHFSPESPRDEDDNIPPGFGPMVSSSVAKDDDDLPEFNFYGRASSSIPRIPQNLHQPTQRPVGQLRELIQKYGQGGTGVPIPGHGVTKWNYDDDDDIPEWQPETLNETIFGHRLHIPAAQQIPLMSPRSTRSLLPQSPGVQWTGPPDQQHEPRWRQS